MKRATVARRSRAAAEPALVFESSKLRLLGIALLCLKVASVPLVFDESLDMPFSVSKAVLSHAIAWVLAGIVVALLVRFGPPFLVWSQLHVPVAAFLAVSLMATLFAADRALALYGTHARMLGLASIADGVVLYVAVVFLVRTRRDGFAVVISALAASSVVLGYELVQALGRDPFHWTLDGATRPFSTLGHATVLAHYLTVLALGAFGFGLLIDRISFRARAFVILYSLVLLIGSAATGTRSMVLGLGAGGALLLVLAWRVLPSRRARTAILLGVAAATAGLAGFLFLSPLGARLATTIEGPRVEEDDQVAARLEPSAAGRVVFYELGLDMVRERPLLGYGPDNFTVGVPRYRPEAAPEVIRQDLPTSTHGWVIHVATSSGIAGLACFIAISLVALRLVVAAGFRPAALTGVAMLGAFLGAGVTTVNETGTDWLFWASIGTIAASTAASGGSLKQREPQRSSAKSVRPWGDSRLKRVVAVLVVSTAAVVAFTGLTALDASRSARGSQEARFSGQRQLAVDFGLRATRSDPGRPEYWHILGLAYASTTSWREAVAAFDHASALAPYDVRYIGDLVSAQLILASSGDALARARARELAEKVVQTDPNNPRAHLTRAVVMQFIGDSQEALRSVERALALDPNSTNDRLYVTAGQVMLAVGRSDDAIRLMRQGLAILGQTISSIAIRVELARALAASGQVPAALAELDVALKIQPNNATVQRIRTEIAALAK